MNQNPRPIVVVQIIWFALLASCFMLLVPLAVALESEFQFNFSMTFWTSLIQESPMVLQMVVMACVVLVISQVLPNRIYALARTRMNRAETPTEMDRMRALYVPFIIRCAMTEAVTLFGFVSAFVFARDSRAIVPFLIVSVLNYFRIFPATLEKMNRDLGGES